MQLPMRPDGRWDTGEGSDWVGRVQERSALSAALDRLGSRSTVLVEVIGEPGIGKTRLLAELIALASTRGLRVCTARASWARRSVPFGVFLDAFGGPETERARRILERFDGHDPEERYARVGAELAELAPAGLLLTLDDLHWIDDRSLELLAHLVRRPPHGPVLLALAYRPRQAPGGLRAATAAALSGPPAIRLHLGPLSKPEADTLLGAHCSPALYLESGGNPLYLRVLAHAARTHRQPPSPSVTDLRMGVEAAVLGELEALSPLGREVVRAAAVTGEPFCDESVADVGGLDRATVSSVFQEVAGLDLIRPAHGNSFAFRHPVVRSVVYGSTNPAWRLDAHQRAAVALKRRGRDAPARAYHLERIAGYDDPEAIEVLEAASISVSDRAPALAARWLSAALRLLPDAAAEHRARLLLELARTLLRLGRLRETRETLHRAMELLPRESVTRRADAIVLCARADRLLGHRAEAGALLTAALLALSTRTETDPDRESEAAALEFELAYNTLASGDLIACRVPAQQAAAAVDDPRQPLWVAARGLTALAAAATGELDTAAAHLDAAVPILDGMLDGDLAERLEATVLVARCERLLERPAEALRHLDRGAALARRGDRHAVLPDLLVARALALRDVGRLSEANECAREAVDLAVATGSREQRIGALAARSWVAVWTGDSAAALADAEAALAHDTSGMTAVRARRAHAEACLAMGDIDGCLASVAHLGGPDLPAIGAWWRVGWYELLTRAALAAGRIGEADRWARLGRSAAAGIPLAGRDGLASLAESQVRVRRGQQEAATVAVAAHDALAAAGLALDAARAWLVEGAALAGRGEAEQAGARLIAAQSQFATFGANDLVRQAISERRRMAAQSPRGSAGQHRTGFAGLTRRERQIAQLVGEGLTNARIATLLHVTDKTVEKHLSNVFAKLGVSARSQVAATVARARTDGVSDPPPSGKGRVSPPAAAEGSRAR